MLEWFAVMFPLVFSPGPANVLASVSGARVGVIRSLPFFMGINVIFFSYSVLIGLGVGEFLLSYVTLLVIIKYLGAIFVIWLGVKLWYEVKTTQQSISFTFKQGILLQATNPKLAIILIIMFTAFLRPNITTLSHVVVLSMSVVVLNIVNQVCWAVLGKAIAQHYSSDYALKVQGYLFSVLLVLVGVWIAVR